MSEFIRGRAGDTILIAEPTSSTTYTATIYPALPGVDVQTLADVSPAVLNAITHMRVDTVNACNLDCVFCHSDFSAKAKHLEISQFSEAFTLDRFPSVSKLTMGCAYEPLMGKYFEEFPGSIASLRGKFETEIVTNGILLNRKDLTPYVEFGLNRLHVSVYSHIADIYEKTGRKHARFAQLEENLIETRRRFPDLEIHITNPISRSNDVDLAGFARWALEKIGATTVDLRRAFFVDDPSPGYPAYSYVTEMKRVLGRGPRLTDDEWRKIVDGCADYIRGNRMFRLGGDVDFESIVLCPKEHPIPQIAA